MKRSHPLAITMPAAGVLFAESVHAGDFHMARRTDPFHKLLYVLRGHVSYTEMARQPESVSTGMLLIIPSGISHEISDQLPSTLFLLCVSPTFLKDDPELTAIWDELADRDVRRIALSRPTRHHVESAWRQAMLERIRPRTGSLVTIRALAARSLVTLVRMPALNLSIILSLPVAAVAREMENTFYDEWNLDRAATRAGISRRHFSALFNKLQATRFGNTSPT